MDALSFAHSECSGSEAGSYLRLIYCVYHSTLGLRVIKKRERRGRIAASGSSPATCKRERVLY